MNTAQIVVSGHEGDKEQPLKYPEDDVDKAKCWMILVSSLLVTIAGGWYTIGIIKNANSVKRDTITSSSIICFIFLVFSVYVQVKVEKKFGFVSIHIIILVIMMFVSLLVACFVKKDIKNKGSSGYECCWWKIIGVFPSWYYTAQHTLWVLCGGISSEPAWAVPMFLIECFTAVIIVCIIYLCCLKIEESKKPNQSGQNDQKNKNVEWFIAHLVVGFLALGFSVATAVLSFYHHIGLSTENILEVIMAAALVWLVKNSGIFSETDDKARQTDKKTDTKTDTKTNNKREREEESLL